MNGSAIKMVKVNVMWVLWKQRRMLGANITNYLRL